MQLASQFVDSRLKKNGKLFFNRMVERKTVCIRHLANDRAERIRFERWLRNDEVSVARLIHTEQERIRQVVKNRHVLGIQDTTELNYQKHAGRVYGLGTVGNGKDAGFFMHPMLVIDRETHACLGSAAIHVWNRVASASKGYQTLPIEEKESYRWISTAEVSKKILSEAESVTFLGDRENDIYEFIDRIPDRKTHIITRNRHDRLLKKEGKLFDYLDKKSEGGKLKIIVPPEIRKGRKKREAELSIKYGEVEMIRPQHCTDKTASKTIKIQVVEAKEINCPRGEKPIHWRLLTTHHVPDLESAKQIISWYKQRWNIEQIFRTMKQQGLDIESSQVESGKGLMKLGIIALCAAIQIMQLVLAREGTTQQKISDVFDANTQFFLEKLLIELEGKTAKQKNPHSKENLAWAAWIIARLGGWHGYKSSEGLPGPIVIGRGLKEFYHMYNGWNLAKNVCAE